MDWAALNLGYCEDITKIPDDLPDRLQKEFTELRDAVRLHFRWSTKRAKSLARRHSDYSAKDLSNYTYLLASMQAQIFESNTPWLTEFGLPILENRIGQGESYDFSVEWLLDAAEHPPFTDDPVGNRGLRDLLEDFGDGIISGNIFETRIGWTRTIVTYDLQEEENIVAEFKVGYLEVDASTTAGLDGARKRFQTASGERLPDLFSIKINVATHTYLFDEFEFEEAMGELRNVIEEKKQTTEKEDVLSSVEESDAKVKKNSESDKGSPVSVEKRITIN